MCWTGWWDVGGGKGLGRENSVTAAQPWERQAVSAEGSSSGWLDCDWGAPQGLQSLPEGTSVGGRGMDGFFLWV